MIFTHLMYFIYRLEQEIHILSLINYNITKEKKIEFTRENLKPLKMNNSLTRGSREEENAVKSHSVSRPLSVLIFVCQDISC